MAGWLARLGMRLRCVRTIDSLGTGNGSASGEAQEPFDVQNDVEITELGGAVRAIEVRGARLPDAVQAFSNVEAPPKK